MDADTDVNTTSHAPGTSDQYRQAHDDANADGYAYVDADPATPNRDQTERG